MSVMRDAQRIMFMALRVWGGPPAFFFFRIHLIYAQLPLFFSGVVVDSELDLMFPNKWTIHWLFTACRILKIFDPLEWFNIYYFWVKLVFKSHGCEEWFT